MRYLPRPSRFGLTFIELLMALAVTAMVATAIAAMWTAISSGERARRDNRAFIVRTYAAKARISAYVAPCRSVLFAEKYLLVLWRDDSRESGTVHVSEIRWLVFDEARGDLDVCFLKFPSTPSWTEAAKALRDEECALDTDWKELLDTCMGESLIGRLTLVDALDAVKVSLDAPAALDAREVTCQLDFRAETPGQIVSQTLTASIMAHVTPGNPGT